MQHHTSAVQHRGQRRAQRVVLGWLLLGLAAFALLPWYFPQQLTLAAALPGVFGGADTASGLVQALQHGKPWLWSGLAGLALAFAAWR
ncbi:MAG: iron ABC transporter permease, partial [Rubrivivax sp.]|nr:iron ABC transporter permease [Rubrivivax sp.]